METFVTHFWPALAIVLDPWNLFIIFLGVVFGIVVGVLPGFGPAQALALMFPFTFAMSPETAVIFFLSIYSAAEYGGSIPAILIRMPGGAAAAITVLDGYPMARSGRANRALQLSLYGGVIGGIVSSLIFILSATGLAWVGLQFGPGELFAVGVFGLSLIGSFFGRSVVRGFTAAAIGLLLATVGSSGFAGLRFTFGLPALSEGIPTVIVITAFLAMPEVFQLMVARARDEDGIEKSLLGKDDRGLSLRDLRRLMPTIMRGSLIGTAIGSLPGPGAAVASLVAYNEEKRWSKHPELFGTGLDEGIAAPETANNAIVAGALVPSLALGIPSSAAIAVLVGMLITKGVVPGPMLFAEGGPLVAAIFLGLIACNIVMLAVGLGGARIFALVARIPRHILAPFVLLNMLVGVYAYQNYSDHIVLLVVLGAFACWLERLGFSVVPVVLGFVMGPIVEQNLVRALAINGGDVGAVLGQPITLGILAVAGLTAFFGFRRELRSARQAERAVASVSLSAS